MRPTQHPTNTRVLGAPAGWDQGELPCSAIAITDSQENGVHCVTSFWRPTAEELAALQAGHFLALTIVGTTMPPAQMWVAE